MLAVFFLYIVIAIPIEKEFGPWLAYGVALNVATPTMRTFVGTLVEKAVLPNLKIIDLLDLIPIGNDSMSNPPMPTRQIKSYVGRIKPDLREWENGNIKHFMEANTAIRNLMGLLGKISHEPEAINRKSLNDLDRYGNHIICLILLCILNSMHCFTVFLS